MKYTLFNRFSITSVILIAAVMLVTNGYSQKYGLKKEVIVKDKLPYANLIGEAGYSKPARLTILSLNGDSLVRIKAWKYPNGNPRGQELNGFQIEFVKSGKSLLRPSTYSTKGKIVDFFFDDFPLDLIVNNAIDPGAEDQYISKFDKTNDVKLTQLDEKAESDYLKKILPIFSDADTAQAIAGISVKLIKEVKNRDGSITQETEIYIGGTYLMSMRKWWTSSWNMTFYRNVKDKVEIRGTGVGFVNIATLNIPPFALSNGIGNSDLFTVLDSKSQEIKIHAPLQAEKEVTIFLIRHKYL